MKKGRKPYQKPRIEEVKLAPEEAVLANCKSANGANNTRAQRCYSSPTCTNKSQGS